MAGPESRYIKKVLTQIKKYPEIYYMQNTNPYVSGIPDIYFEGCESCIWIEAKAIPLWPKQLDCTKLLTANQLKWLKRANKNEVNVAVIVGTPSGEGVILENLSWELVQPTNKLKKYTPKGVAQKLALKLLKPTQD